MISKILSSLVTSLLSKGFAALQDYMQKRKVGKLEQQVSSLNDKVAILEQEKKKQKKIEDWKYRLQNKENDSLAEELNKIRNEE
jgi:outer membrane murein-binding lipoprotein Lpp